MAHEDPILRKITKDPKSGDIMGLSGFMMEESKTQKIIKSADSSCTSNS